MALCAPNASADTLLLDTGVQVDGVLTETPDGLYRLEVGSEVVFYQKSEVVSIERNDKTGALDLDAVMAEAKRRDDALTAETGLTGEQRARVQSLLYDLMQDGPPRLRAREALVAMAEECDIFKFLQYTFGESNQNLAPVILDMLYRLDPVRALPFVREQTGDLYDGTRKQALSILGLAADALGVELAARGLIDTSFEVRVAAAYALAGMGAKGASPALIANLGHPDLRVSNSARESLEKIWEAEVASQKPQTVSEWKAFWDANKPAAGKVYAQDGLEPLSPPDAPFVAG